MAGKPITIITAGASAALAISLAGLLVKAYHDPVFAEHKHLVTCCFSPVLMLSIGVFLLWRGSRVGRVLLGLVFLVLLIALTLLGVYSVTELDASLQSLQLPFLLIGLLIPPTYLLLFSRRLSTELTVARQARGSEPAN